MVQTSEQHRATSPLSGRRARAMMLPGLVAVVLLNVLSQPAHALIVGATPNVVPNTSAAPADNPGFLHAVATGNFNAEGVCMNFCLNGVYLGDGWILSAKHAGVNSVKFDHLSAPLTPIPNQVPHVVTNPTIPGLTLSTETDLRLYRVKGQGIYIDPGLPPLTIASQPLTLNSEVTMIATGVTRTSEELHFSVDTSVTPPAWTQVSSRSTYNGYGFGGQGKRWGKNHVADDDPVFNESDANLTGIVNTNAGHVIAYVTTFDENSSNPYESQAVGGDSGSGVFYKRNGQWELAGITFANLIYPGQSISGGFNSPNSLAIYGNATAFADLSSYRNQIQAIMAAHADYSIAGDVNLDGVLSGNGTGPAASDDITSFVQGWRYNNFTGKGDIYSWSKGDLNRDGVVNATDFFWLRQAFGATGNSTISLDALAAGTLGLTIPEPSSVALVLLSAGTFLAAARRRTRSAV